MIDMRVMFIKHFTYEINKEAWNVNKKFNQEVPLGSIFECIYTPDLYPSYSFTLSLVEDKYPLNKKELQACFKVLSDENNVRQTPNS